MSHPQTAISVADLRVEYLDQGRKVRALDGISLEIRQGEKVAVIGPSGSGKSTFIRVLSGLVEPSEGHVEVAGRRLGPNGAIPREHYRDVGLVFQSHGLVPQLSARRNVLCGRLFDYGPAAVGFRPEHDAKAEEYLRHLGLGERIDVPVSRLSGGERQRVALARLLLQNPSVALLDEPISNLDVHWATRAVDSLQELRDGEGTVVMVAHDLDLARMWADRVVYLRDGRLVADGDPDAVCRQFEELGDTVETSPDDAETDGALAGQVAGQEAGKEEPDEPLSPGMNRKGFYALVGAGLIAAFIWAAIGVEFSASKLFGNLDNAADFLGRLFPPDFSDGVTEPVLASLIETIQMALLGTSLAAVLSLPIAVMAARNISPGWLRTGARLVLNLLRTVPSIIWGLFFVAIVGLGPFPGILALTFYASGYLGKFYYEGIESIDIKPLRALKTVGAGRIHRFRFGVLPQVIPLLLGYTLYMFEYNVRSASILGVVGAGGIGFYLYTYINNFNYAKATTALLALLVVVTAIDALSSVLRRRLGQAA
ncbi:phosphonate ABC transporter, permease protein PhnE [Persicimonas caeni]|uniref:Phosphonate ABC transporter, permease protein PhnE n=1 Tax=Persicimonas caeni TaxID=2292766 RepID=A0A4Y6PXP3_PERCE|nr:phosphonate ABC transporter, permease protein PhnE [Persicimonas caeni]QDG53033.1 phosphonate ABC transporter, permease protein PhnE [Persicimonas caeni]QED34255.1 phosphonate ABC transporter, permease protein PhnE [Persicimonas caeni]